MCALRTLPPAPPAYINVMKKLLVIILLIVSIGALVYLFKPTDLQISLQGKREVKTKFAILSDTHSDSENTRRALTQAKRLGAKFIMNTGDLTTVGSISELSEAKEDFDSSGLEYFVVPGDHDLYNSAGTDNFRQVFGPNYYVTSKDGIRFISLDTSDTSVGINDNQLTWLEQEFNTSTSEPTFVMMHLPVYHPTSPRTIWEKGGNNEVVKQHAEKVIDLFKGRGVLATFSGDHHFSSDYTESESGVKMYIVGAVTRERNLQKPRFALVTVFDDNSFEVEEVVIE
jgi:predicted phosphodiesterase